MNTPLVKGGCGHSAGEVVESSFTFGVCFITALLIIGGLIL